MSLYILYNLNIYNNTIIISFYLKPIQNVNIKFLKLILRIVKYFSKIMICYTVTLGYLLFKKFFIDIYNFIN